MIRATIESSVSMVSLEGETAAEIATAYEKVCNEAFANVEIKYSNLSGEMLRYGPNYLSLREIKGKWYAEIERCFFNNPVEKEEDL